MFFLLQAAWEYVTGKLLSLCDKVKHHQLLVNCFNKEVSFTAGIPDNITSLISEHKLPVNGMLAYALASQNVELVVLYISVCCLLSSCIMLTSGVLLNLWSILVPICACITHVKDRMHPVAL